MENNFCPHCGKSTKDDKSRDEEIDELLESFKSGDVKPSSKQDKTTNRMEK